jgi:hypothetical protein
MNPGQVRIEKLSLRMRGVTPQQARQRADSIARDIARAIRENASLLSATTTIPRLAIRVAAGGKTPGIDQQIRAQLSEDRPRT